MFLLGLPAIPGEQELPRLSSRDMESLRQCVRPGLVGASNERLERIVSESLSSLPAATSEDFLSTLGSFGKAALPALEKAAPSVLQGAAQGGSVGGPYGAVIGGGLGLVKGLVQQQGGTRAPAASPPAPTHAPAPAQTATATSATSSAGTPPELPVGQGAAATVVGLLQNPIIQQALLSQVLGSSGRTTVQAPSGAELPRASINQLLSQLLANSVEGLAESESISEQSYLMDDTGEYLVDPASPEQQAAMVLAHLQAGRSSGESDGDDPEAQAGLWDELEWISDDLGEDVDSLDENYEAEFY
jgi:hypothetical protein